MKAQMRNLTSEEVANYMELVKGGIPSFYLENVVRYELKKTSR